MTTAAGFLDRSAEYLQLVGVRFRTLGVNLLEFGKVVWRFYRRPRFALTDLSLLSLYLWRNPYRICKEYLIKKGEEDPYTYGETPLTTMAMIARRSEIEASDVVYELGAGRGRTSFWLHQFVGCRVVAFEQVPLFVKIARQVQDFWGADKIEFRQQDFLEADFSKASVVYLYGSCMKEREIEALVDKMRALPAGAKVVTVSFGLEGYDPDLFVTMRCFKSQFTWGSANVYYQVRR